jgi:hypothetical protein
LAGAGFGGSRAIAKESVAKMSLHLCTAPAALADCGPCVTRTVCCCLDDDSPFGEQECCQAECCYALLCCYCCGLCGKLEEAPAQAGPLVGRNSMDASSMVAIEMER